MRPLDDELRDFGWEYDAGGDGGLALAHEGLQQPAELLEEEDDAGADDPLPELGRVQDEECPVAPVELKHTHVVMRDDTPEMNWECSPND